MPKNVKGGSKHKKQKNNTNDDYMEEIIYKNGEEQDYGKVDKLLGNCRVSLLCNDNENRIGIIRGSMRKKQWINVGNIVIYTKRLYEKDKVDIIHVYNNNILKMIESKLDLNFKVTEDNNDIFDIDSDNIEESIIIDDI